MHVVNLKLKGKNTKNNRSLFCIKKPFAITNGSELLIGDELFF